MQAIFEALRVSLTDATLLSSISALVLAYFGGVLSSLSPCIYPMIPVTIGVIGGARENTVVAGWVFSSTYVLGMALVYTVLGVFAAATGQVFGSLTNTPAWYLLVGGIMLFSALWMFDVIRIDFNAWIHRFKIKRSHRRHSSPAFSIGGVFLFGLTSGFIAAPCTTPVLTTILSYITGTRSLLFGGLLMFSFSLGLGTFLVLVGTFTGLLKVLPKSGQWLQRLKWFSAFLILILAEYFIYKAGTLQ